MLLLSYKTQYNASTESLALSHRLEVRGARRQNLKLAWEDAWNHARIKLLHRLYTCGSSQCKNQLGTLTLCLQPLCVSAGGEYVSR